MASPAEERLRIKAEAALRSRRPDARIIHELSMRQEGCRIDLAAVWPDGMILVELKSERDDLDRLRRQVREALGKGCEVWLCFAERWREARYVMSASKIGAERHAIYDRRGAFQGFERSGFRNPDYVPGIDRCVTFFEAEDGLVMDEADARANARWRAGRAQDSAALLSMLWASELAVLTGRDTRYSRTDQIAFALETMTGRDIRRATCRALRARDFPRADPAIPFDQLAERIADLEDA